MPAEQTSGGIAPGARVAHYEVYEQVGNGGMSDVYRARNILTGAVVALKVLSPAYSVGNLAARFQREARNAKRLNHPGCVRVLDHGRAGDGTLYLAMELFGGRTLRDELRNAGKFSIGHAVRVVRELLAGLAHAHDAGVLHRDIKPENVMFRARTLPEGPIRVRRQPPPRVVLIDFGLSQLRDDAPLTAAGTCVGSPSYIAPERILERDYDARADIYAVGVILYELLAGRPPYTGINATAIARQHIENTPLPIRRLRPETPASLEIVVGRALAKSPDERFSTAREMLEALRRVPMQKTMPIAVPPPPSASQTISIPIVWTENSTPTNDNSTDDLPSLRPTPIWIRAGRWLAGKLGS